MSIRRGHPDPGVVLVNELDRVHLVGAPQRNGHRERSLPTAGRGLLLENVLGADEAARPKRALLSYLVLPFLLDADSPDLLKHGNRWRAREIARYTSLSLAGEFGRVVRTSDLVDE